MVSNSKIGSLRSINPIKNNEEYKEQLSSNIQKIDNIDLPIAEEI